MKNNRLTKIFNSIAKEFKDNVVADGVTVTAVTGVFIVASPLAAPVALGGSVLGVGAYRIAKGTYKGFKRDN
jgi:hypothetical protein